MYGTVEPNGTRQDGLALSRRAAILSSDAVYLKRTYATVLRLDIVRTYARWALQMRWPLPPPRS